MNGNLQFATHDLGDGCEFLVGRIPSSQALDPMAFQRLWDLHPAERTTIQMLGRAVRIPRWQQAYDVPYFFSGQTSPALAAPEILRPLKVWVAEAIDPRLNGILLNWYEGPGHYIGPHHDSTIDMVHGAPIVTISLGETRTFRLTKGKGESAEVRDFPAHDGSVFSMPFGTNLVWKHGVPKSTRYVGRRISVTFRAFEIE